MPGYSDITVNDRNPVKRRIQRKRLEDAVSALGDLDAGFSGRFLDFGGGSGELSKLLARAFPKARVFCYEPAPALFEEARRNLAGLRNAVPVPSTEQLGSRRFDHAFCLEVFEHLSPRHILDAALEVKRRLKRDGLFVVGVPNELFAPALVKGVFRMTRRYGDYDARPSNVLRAAVGRPPKDRPVRRIATGFPYHFHHTGFDYRELRELLCGPFDLVRQFGSPVRFGVPLNPEVYFVFRRPNYRLPTGAAAEASAETRSRSGAAGDEGGPELGEGPGREAG
jgi:SAM-dependent methyltransferase